MDTNTHSNKFLKLGEHFICELSDCEPALLFDGERARTLFTNAVKSSGLTVVGEGYYQFNPHGFTCYLLLAESHASLHAWPEYGYCALDLFTCNLNLEVIPLFETLKNSFKANHSSVQMVERRAHWEAVWQAA
jgi:S-adenosylmethionine decarboxylase